MSNLTVTITLNDETDLTSFRKYVNEAKKDHGSVSPLYNGLMTSALRDAKVEYSDDHLLLFTIDAAENGETEFYLVPASILQPIIDEHGDEIDDPTYVIGEEVVDSIYEVADVCITSPTRPVACIWHLC